jgi:EmrB/QacA subfamily drug resistance transporter
MKSNTYKRFAIIILAIAQLILALDFTIIYVALPSIGQDLHFSASSLQWVVSAYALTFGGFLLIGGRMSDLLGQRRMFILAMVIFGLASLFGGFAHTQLLLIAARGLQGLGGAILFPATLSLIMSSFQEGAERNRALGIWAAMGGVGLSLGLLLGGVLTSYIGWTSTFFVNVPIALVVTLAAPFVLNENILPSKKRSFDIAGAISITSAMILIVYYLVQAPSEGWLALSCLIPALIGLVLVGVFFLIEKRTREPLIPFRLFRIRTLNAAVITAAIFSASFGTLYYFLTLYMQQALHYTAVQSGLGFLPLTLSALLGAKLVNRMLSAFGIAGTLGSGMALGVAGFMLLTPLSPHGTFWGFLPGILIAGLGQAIVFTTMFIAAGTGIEPKDQGVSSAIVSTGQQIGSAIGLAIIMAIVTAATTADSALEAQTPEMLTHSIQLAFYTNAAFALIGVIVAFVMLRNKKTSAKQ